MTLLSVPKSGARAGPADERQAPGADSVVLARDRQRRELYGLGEQYWPLDLTGSITPICPGQGVGPRGSSP